MDGESAETVTNERHKVHFRPALVPHATLSGHHRHSQAQAYHGRRIVIPEVTRDNQAAQKSARQDAEVANFYRQSGEQSMAQLIEFVEKRKLDPLRPPRALSEYGF